MRGHAGSRSRLTGRVVLGLTVALAAGCRSDGGGGADGAGGGDQGGAGGGDADSRSGGDSATPEVGGGSATGATAGEAEETGAGGGGGASSTGGAGGTPAAGGASGQGGVGGAAGALVAARCAALICDDFEGGAFSDQWRREATGSTVEKVAGAHGQYAARFHVRPLTMGTSIRYNKAFDHKGPLYARMYMLLSPDHNFGHTWMFRTGADPNVEWGGQFDKWIIAPAGVIGRGEPFPTKKWVCVQWEITDAPLKLVVKVDGQPAATQTAPGAALPASFLPLRFGLVTYHPEDIAESDFYIDDLVIDGKPVACL